MTMIVSPVFQIVPVLLKEKFIEFVDLFIVLLQLNQFSTSSQHIKDFKNKGEKCSRISGNQLWLLP
jgi:hypothetical protein